MDYYMQQHPELLLALDIAAFRRQQIQNRLNNGNRGGNQSVSSTLGQYDVPVGNDRLYAHYPNYNSTQNNEGLASTLIQQSGIQFSSNEDQISQNI